MTSRAFLEYFGQLRGLARPAARSRAEECLALVGLDDCAGRSLDQLSGGEVRRLFIAQSLVHDPQLLVLDEPTAGLDPLARIELRELIDNMRDGRIIVMATHLLEDVIHLAAMVKVLDQGRLVWQGSAAELGAITSQAGQGSSRLGSPEELGFAELFADHRAENG
jgi:ABC-2 type transport system ATP-binding protein